MGKVISIQEFKDSKQYEEDYLKFLTYVNKYLKVPSDIPTLSRNFYYTLRYLEGTINCFSILTLLKQVPQEQMEEMRVHIINYMQELLDQLKTC